MIKIQGGKGDWMADAQENEKKRITWRGSIQIEISSEDNVLSVGSSFVVVFCAEMSEMGQKTQGRFGWSGRKRKAWTTTEKHNEQWRERTETRSIGGKGRDNDISPWSIGTSTNGICAMESFSCDSAKAAITVNRRNVIFLQILSEKASRWHVFEEFLKVFYCFDLSCCTGRGWNKLSSKERMGTLWDTVATALTCGSSGSRMEKQLLDVENHWVSCGAHRLDNKHARLQQIVASNMQSLDTPHTIGRWMKQLCLERHGGRIQKATKQTVGRMHKGKFGSMHVWFHGECQHWRHHERFDGAIQCTRVRLNVNFQERETELGRRLKEYTEAERNWETHKSDEELKLKLNPI